MRSRIVPAVAAVGAAALIASCRPADHAPLGDRDANQQTAEAAPRASVTLDTRRRQLAGTKTARVERAPVSVVVRATGSVVIPETGLSEISVKVDGWVRDLKANTTGMTVQQGDPLFVLYSPIILALENEFVAALHGRQQAAKSSTPEAREHADQIVDIVRGRLLLADVSVNEVRELERRGRALGEMTFLAPASGVIVEKQVVEGMYVTAGQRLFRLADLSTLWIEADVHERDLALLVPGQRATVALDAFPGDRFEARVAFVGAMVSDATRTVKVRLEVPNRGRRLRPGMYAAVTVASEPRVTLTVPIDAVVDSGTEQTVFLSEGEGYFEPRQVRTGRRFGDRIEILDGLSEGQVVADGATFFIDSESQLRGALRSYSRPAGATGSSTAAEPGSESLIELHVSPNPPRAGALDLEVVLTRAGAPVDAADVRAVFSMPPMPSMGMGAMRAEARLAAAGGGRYTGRVEIAHAGRWDVDVAATRDGTEIGRRQSVVLIP